MSAAWFRYERTNGVWWPAVFYGDKPKAPKGEEDRFTSPVAVPAECLDLDGSAHFGALQRAFPAPESK